MRMTSPGIAVSAVRLGFTFCVAMIAAHVASLPVLAQSDANVCVALDGSGSQVAGLQLGMAWDSSCMTANKLGGNAAACNSNPDTGKNVQTALQSTSSMKVLFLSFSDTNPIPDGDLFCCRFTRVKTAPACCGMQLGNVIYSDATGRRVTDAGVTVMASVDGQPCAASSSTLSAPPQGGGGLPQARDMGVPPAVVVPQPNVNSGGAPSGGSASGRNAPAAFVPPAQAPAPAQAGAQGDSTAGNADTPTAAPATRTQAAQRTSTPRGTITALTPTPVSSTPQSTRATPMSTPHAATPQAMTPTLRAGTPKAAP